MTEADSPIHDFYPLDFETDLNGKKADWEALVLIPFIDQVCLWCWSGHILPVNSAMNQHLIMGCQERLLAGMALYEPQLSPEERARNIHSNALSYSFSRERTIKMASPYPATFPDVVAHVQQHELPFPHAAEDTPPLRYLDTFDQARYYPGFPTFRFMPHTFDRRFAQVKVFSFPSKSESIVMDVSQSELAHMDASTAALQQHYLNAVVWVRWPHLLEARVVAVSSEGEKYMLNTAEPPQAVRVPTSSKDSHGWRDQANYLHTLMLSSRGLDIGDVKAILHVQLSQGYQDVYTARGTVIRRRVWSRRETQYPLQVCLKDLVVHREDDNEAEVPMADRLQEGAEFCFLGHPYYGHLGQITSLQADTGQVSVEINPRPAPYVQDLIDSAAASDGQYFNLGTAAHMLHMPTHLLNRLIGDIYLFDGTPKEPGQKLNAGLRLKFNKRNEQVIGMTQRRQDGQWYVSQRALQLLQHYQQSFPQVFQGLVRAGRVDNFYAQLMFRDKAATVMQALRNFVKTDLKTRDRETVPVGTQVIPTSALNAMEERLEAELAAPAEPSKPVKVAKVHPKFLLLQHTVLRDGLGQAPDSEADFQLGDRVVRWLWMPSLLPPPCRALNQRL
jgi:5'-3' exoribonuclease 1